MQPTPRLKLVRVEHGMPFDEMMRRAEIARTHPDLDPERMRSWGSEVRQIAVGIVRPRTRLWHRDLGKIQPDRMGFVDLWQLLAYVATLREFRPSWRFVGPGSRIRIGTHRHEAVPVVKIGEDGRRYLSLEPIRYGWTPGYAFPVQGDPRLIMP